MLFDYLNREVKEHRAENIELKCGLEFSQAEIGKLKVIVPGSRVTKETEHLI